MSRSAAARAATGVLSTTSRPGRSLGWAVLALWLAVAVGGLAVFARPPAQAAVTETTAAGWARWARALPGAQAHRPLLVRLAPCGCDDDRHWAALAERWNARGVVLALRAGAPLPAGLAANGLLALDARGQVIYSGPVAAPASCGLHHPAELALISGIPVHFDEPCPCPRTP